MGCYGIGVGRTVAAAIEQNHDHDGIIWPMPLAPYAITDANSKGRRFGVVETADRNQFQRDYTRVLHSQAFRRLPFCTGA